MKNYYSLLIIILLLIPITSVHGLGGGKGYVNGKFWGADLNRNERIDPDEAKVVYNLSDEEIFERYDKNEDGYINFFEFSEFMQQSPWTKPFTHPSEF